MVAASERAIMPRFRQLGADQVRQKARDELVTIADIESEAILTEGLSKILPEAAVVGEEAADADPALLNLLGNRLCWVVDPLDGTANFAAGEGPFGILIALTDHSQTIAGWIFDPLSGRFIASKLGEGTAFDGEIVRSRESDGRPRTAAISSLFIDPDRLAGLHDALDPHFQAAPIPRCAAEQYPRIIMGVNDLTLFERTLPWDHAAGILCLTEAGGVATRFDGSPYRVGDERTGLIAAATPELWEEALGYIGAE